MQQQPDWLLWAWRELGVHEVAGRGDNPRIIEMFKDVGHSAVEDDEVAWCAAFAGACLERSGHRSTRSLMARSYLTWGEPLDEGRYGAIAVLSRGDDPALGHVGFVVGEADRQIFLLGGNQSNGVTVASYAKDRLLGYRWPQSPVPVEAEEENSARTNDGVHAGEVATLFDSALAHVLEMEGGYTDDPNDPGGPTNKGITLAVFARWLGEPVTTGSRSRLVARLKRIPDAMVREIYVTRYWTPAECERLIPALALMHFDAAVNHGVQGAIRILQQAVGANVDGEIGPETRRCISAKPIAETLLAYAEIRRDRYRALKHFWRFGRGWMRRVDRTLIRAGQAMEHCVGQVADREASVHEARKESKQSTGDRNMTTQSEQDGEQVPNSKWWGESMTIWGVIVTAAATVLPVLGPLIGLDITGEMVRQIGQQVTEVIQALGGVLGTILAIYGRVRATQPVARRLMAVKI